jgi:predicted acetyltransferase
MYKISEGRPEYKDDVIRMFWKAFEPTANLDELREEDWTDYWNNQENDDFAYVALHHDKAVANVSFFASTENEIRGRPVKIAGVSGVATEPNHRRVGLVRSIFQQVFPRMREEGMVLSILDPFYIPFYEKFGYAVAESRTRHQFNPREFRDIEEDSGLVSRELTDPKESDLILEVEKTMSRFGSRLFHFKRSVERAIKQNQFYILEEGSEPVASVGFSVSRKNSNRHLKAYLSYFKSCEYFRPIVNLVSQYAVNSEQVIWYCDNQAPVRLFTKHHDAVTTQEAGSMMMRVIDFEGYCRSIAVPETAEKGVHLTLKDEHCDWNSGTYELRPEGGRLECERVAPTSPEIKLDTLGISRVISGLNAPTTLRGLGLIDCSKQTASKLEALFPPDNFVSYERF